jgi:hypothetical protein
MHNAEPTLRSAVRDEPNWYQDQQVANNWHGVSFDRVASRPSNSGFQTVQRRDGQRAGGLVVNF